MHKPSLASFGRSLLCLALLALATQAQAAPSEFAGRGVYHFASDSGCATSLSSDIECNRVALDVADARASVDRQARAIVIEAADNHDDKTVIGDILLHGSGIAGDGQRVP